MHPSWGGGWGQAEERFLGCDCGLRCRENEKGDNECVRGNVSLPVCDSSASIYQSIVCDCHQLYSPEPL